MENRVSPICGYTLNAFFYIQLLQYVVINHQITLSYAM